MLSNLIINLNTWYIQKVNLFKIQWYEYLRKGHAKIIFYFKIYTVGIFKLAIKHFANIWLYSHDVCAMDSIETHSIDFQVHNVQV